MARILLQHTSGSHVDTVSEFPLEGWTTISIGRDPSADVAYDATQDDLVSRQHAKLTHDSDDPTVIRLEDAGSRNGTFVNRQRITGSVILSPGDVVQLGVGGPQFTFEMEPRPMRATREYAVPVGATREFDRPANIEQTPPPGDTVGRATVERMMLDTKRHSRRGLFVVGGIALVIILGLASVVGYSFLRGKSVFNANPLTNTGTTPTAIVEANRNAVVLLQAGWKLMYTPKGTQVYQQYIENSYDGNPICPNGKPYIAVYTHTSDDTLEPLLTLSNSPGNEPIGGELLGTGFCVKSNGFFLTNRHMAAAWRNPYEFDADASPGIEVDIDGNPVLDETGRPRLVTAPTDWVPSESKQAEKRIFAGGLEGHNDYLYAFFPKDSTPIPGTTVRVSDQHDVALVKIDAPQDLQAVQLFDSYDLVKPGDAITVLGYPAVSPPVVRKTTDDNLGTHTQKTTIVPDPTVSVGNIGRVLRSADDKSGDRILSVLGDYYQLTVNSTGSGNSGGPIFDNQGRVTGIFTAGIHREGDASITVAIPIRFGMDLLKVANGG